MAIKANFHLISNLIFMIIFNVLILLKPSLLMFVVFYFFVQILTVKLMISFATMMVLVMVGQHGGQFAINLYVGAHWWPWACI